MSTEDLERSFDSVSTELDALWEKQDSPAFREALDRLEQIAIRGSVDAAEALAEALALSGPVHNAASAYKWYYVALSQQGYSVAFQDLNGIPPVYGGPDGDFRNEGMVNGLVEELGFDEVKRLDAEVAAWLASRGAV
jgi:hypothetical protein